jgi:hypothetical protein
VKPVSALYDKYPRADIYVVGSGTSMRVFPVSLLDGRITIGLNQAWKVAPVTYGITIAPHLNVPEFMPGEDARPEITWVTKRDKAASVLTQEQLAHADRSFYSFEIRHGKGSGGDWVTDSGRVLDYVRRPTGDRLYQWSSISQTAVNLAANMGARNVFLVGCDNCSLLDNHHAHQQHTKWLGEPPDTRYLQYYEGLVEVRATLRERGVNLVSLTPFLKLDEPERDFLRLCEELERPEIVRPTHDLSDADHPRRRWEPVPARQQPVVRTVARRARSVTRALRRQRPS